MFDEALTRPLPKRSEIPLDENGRPDFNPENYAYTQVGGREPQSYYWRCGGLERISNGALIQVCQTDAQSRRTAIPRDPAKVLDLYPQLRIPHINLNSDYLLVLKGKNVLNVAAYANLVESGKDPRNHLAEWIRPLTDYRDHNLTFATGADYITEYKDNPIKDYIDEAVKDFATASLLHFFFATPMIGIQTIKALVFLIGLKNAGKSVTLNAICAVYGSYVLTIPPMDLLPFNELRVTKELFANHGKRLLRVDELNGETYFNEPLIKRITGRDGLTNPFVTHTIREFVPQVKVFCDSNAPLRPQIGTQSSIADRLFYFPYGRVITKDQRDPYFESLLTSQENLDAYFSWLVDTCLMDVVRGRLS